MAEYPDTYGWDTVFAISIDKVNKALALKPPSATYTATGPTNKGTASLTWSLTNWQVTDTPGGAEMVISMRFGPGSQLTFTENGVDTNYDVALPGYLCTVTFEAWFPDSGNLVPRTGQNQPWADVDIAIPAGAPSDVKFALDALLSDWFKTPAALALFEQEFLAFDMSADVGADELPWLIPKKLGYAGGVMADGVTKAIGILTMTIAGKQPSAAELRLSPYAIPANADAGFVISRELVMTNMILPSVAGAFSTDGNGDSNNYDMNTQTWQISNKAGLEFKHELNGKDQDCTIDRGNLKVWQDADRLHMTLTPMTMTTDILGLYVDAQIDERLELVLVPKPNDPDAMIFMLNNVDPQAPVTSHRLSTGSEIAVAVIAAVLAAAGIALSIVGFKGVLTRCGLTANSAKIWSRVIAGIVGSGLIVITELAAHVIVWARNGEVQNLPDLGPLVSTSLGRIKWPGATKTKYVATTGQFANGVLLAVDPRFT